jgi:hypothetical protein
MASGHVNRIRRRTHGCTVHTWTQLGHRRGNILSDRSQCLPSIEFALHRGALIHEAWHEAP